MSALPPKADIRRVIAKGLLMTRSGHSFRCPLENPSRHQSNFGLLRTHRLRARLARGKKVVGVHLTGLVKRFPAVQGTARIKTQT